MTDHPLYPPQEAPLAAHVPPVNHPSRPAALIAAAFFVLAAVYGAVTPLFESPDELWHVPYVWSVAQTGQLPMQDPTQPQLWAHEGSQAPLYYVLAALLTAPVPADDLPALLYRNPHADLGRVSGDGNANIVVHTARERWPWRGAALAVHLARLFSALLGTGTVLVVYALGRQLAPERPRLTLLAMAFVAFNPMFIFIAGSVNNDNMITLTATLVLWRLAALLTGEASEPPLWRFALLGLLAGLAALSKLSGLGMVALVGLTLLVWGWRRRSWRVAVAGNALAVMVAALVAGWWYWRNGSLYNGDWTGNQTIVSIMSPRPFAPDAAQWLLEAEGLLRSFWGVFGYFSILLPGPLYVLFSLWLVLGLAGLFIGRARRLPLRLRQFWPVLLGWVGLMAAGLIQYTLLIPSSQGRLLFPAMAALAVLWAAGWEALVPRRWLALPAVTLLAAALWVPWGLIAPAYAPPRPVAGLPSTAQPLGVTFGDVATLLGYEIAQTDVLPGEPLSVTLYWRGERPTSTDYTVFIHLLDEHDLIVAQRDVFHGPGVYPTSQWAAGVQFGDTYVVRLPVTAYAPARAHLAVGLYDRATGKRLLASGGGDSARFGSLQIAAAPGPVPNPQTIRFEDGISLIGYAVDRQSVSPGEAATLTLYWQARGRPSRNYKVFVHLVGENNERAAQHDAEPQVGAAPTGGWVAGQTVVDAHPLFLDPEAPAGAYRLVIGLYDGDSGDRLHVVRLGPDRLQADSVTLGGMRVAAP